jgi:hypothetical protein
MSIVLELADLNVFTEFTQLVQAAKTVVPAVIVCIAREGISVLKSEAV